MRQTTFIVWFLIFLIWAVYRANVFLPEWIDELFIKPLIFVVPVFYIVLAREKKKISDLGLKPKLKDFFLDLFLGVNIGIILALEGLVVNYFKYGLFSFDPILSVKVSGGIIFFLILTFFTSLWEEILGRGFLYQRILKESNNQLHAAVVSSFLFLLLHIPIAFTKLNLIGWSFVTYPLSIMLLGITNCYIFSLRKSLTLPILIHLFWNMTVALYL